MEFHYEPEAPQAFHWERDLQHQVGHILKFQVGSKDFPKDMNLQDPLVTSGAASVKVIGVVDELKWSGRPGGKLELDFVVSTANRRDLLTLLHTGSSSDGNISDLEKATVTLAFVIYDYDPNSKKYFKCFHTASTPITGVIETGTGEMGLQSARKAERDARTKYMNAKDAAKKGPKKEGEDADLSALESAWKDAKTQLETKEREQREAESKGTTEKTIELEVDAKPEDDPLSPQVWMVHTKILPPELEGREEDIHFAVADHQPMVKQWGFKKPTKD